MRHLGHRIVRHREEDSTDPRLRGPDPEHVLGDALGEETGAVDALAGVVRRRYIHALEASDMFGDEMLGELNYTLSDAIEDERSRAERSLTDILSRADEPGPWHAARERGIGCMMSEMRVVFWDELKRFIGDERSFSALRSAVKALPFLT